jgi:predicted NUDIX family phosphoesterase
MAEEQVFGFERKILDELGSFQGFSRDVSRYLPAILNARNNSFRPRSQAETDPSFKQIIPYVIITDGDRVLHYVRGKKSGEQRLVAKGSIGIGGHINSTDDGLFTYEMAVEREVKEEIKIEGKFSTDIIGLINDDSTEVGSVHFGIVHLLHRKPSQIKKNEQLITQVENLTLTELVDRKDTLETWSQLCLDPLVKLLAGGETIGSSSSDKRQATSN